MVNHLVSRNRIEPCQKRRTPGLIAAEVLPSFEKDLRRDVFRRFIIGDAEIYVTIDVFEISLIQAGESFCIARLGALHQLTFLRQWSGVGAREDLFHCSSLI